MKTHLKAGTIIESVIAMVIISVVFSISMMVVEMLINNYRLALDYRVRLSLMEVAANTKAQAHFIDRSIDSIDFRIDQKLIPYSTYQDVYILSLEAYDLNDRLILKQRELVIP